MRILRDGIGIIQGMHQSKVGMPGFKMRPSYCCDLDLGGSMLRYGHAFALSARLTSCLVFC